MTDRKKAHKLQVILTICPKPVKVRRNSSKNPSP